MPSRHNLGARRRWVINATPQMLHPWEQDAVLIN